MPPTETAPRLPRAEIDPAALDLVRRHGAEVMACARRWAETPEDAEDAYQRGLEIMLLKAPSTDPDHLLPWLKTVVKREAWSIRRQRERHTPPAAEFEDLDQPGTTSAHDEAVVVERLRHGAEAMRSLKSNEVRAFVLKAEGLSYEEICEETGWTYTKVNRCLTEGRKRFHKGLSHIESGAECERLAPLLSRLADGEAAADDLATLRPHLRTCLVCRARLRDYRAAPARVAAIAPPVAVGYSLLDSARYLLEAVSGWVSGRGAGLAARWHQLSELALAHKGAAMIASTAVLAGGGAATVATVDSGERSAAMRTAPDRSIAQPPPPTPGANESAEPRDATAPSGGPTRRAAPSDETAPADRDPAPSGRPADEPSEPPSSAGEFTPDPAAAEQAATKPEQPSRAAGPEPDGGGEFSP